MEGLEGPIVSCKCRCVYVYFLCGAQRDKRKKTLCSPMTSAALHPMASLTDSECKRLDAIIRAVGNRLE